MRKIGLIPFDVERDKIAVLLVTSMARRRWILPKGNVKNKEKAVAAVHREAFEEAGIKGIVLEQFPMTLPIGKSISKSVVKAPVTYYPFLVTEQLDAWPERDKRQRHWALLKDSDRAVYREDYIHVLSAFEQLSEWIIKAAKEHKS